MTTETPEEILKLLVYNFKKATIEKIELTDNPKMKALLKASYEKVDSLNEDFQRADKMLSQDIFCKKCTLGLKQKALKDILVWIRVTENVTNFPEKFGMDKPL